jgi:tyrosinase co-factor MelC1
MALITRRHALRLGVIGLTLIGTSTEVAQLASARPPAGDEEPEFAELYRGRRVRGTLPRPGSARAPRVFVDDVEIRLMQDQTSFTTQLNHYQEFSSPRLAARAAVRALNGAVPLPFHA